MMVAAWGFLWACREPKAPQAGSVLVTLQLPGKMKELPWGPKAITGVSNVLASRGCIRKGRIVFGPT